MQSNDALTDEYFAIMNNQFDGDIESRRDAFHYMQSSTAIVKKQVVASSFIPRLFNSETWQAFKTIAETTYAILCKVISEYLANPSYRDVFDFDERLKELILLPRGYNALLPFARIDVFLNEETLECGFCEFNGDGSAGTNENREITNSILNSKTFQAFSKHHTIEPCELFSSWVSEFISIYNTYKHRIDNPRFAICDYLECGVVDEFKVFAGYFEQCGYECVVCDVRDLTFDGKVLRNKDGLEINAIWRRSVTNDVIEHWDESQDLIEALRHEAVALIGSFAGHLVHDKQIFEALRHPKTKEILTKEENEFVERHIPKSYFLDEKEVDITSIKANKDSWIIKPTDNYGATDVYAGVFQTQEEWEELIDQFSNSASGQPFIVQQFITPYQTRTLEPDTNIDSLNKNEIDTKGTRYNNLNGLYLYNGTFQGIFSRLGPYPIISKQHKGITAATIHVFD